ncbi:MAG: hypothetical protein V4724_28185 [Pseudomonadota bacterium]
MPYVQSAAAQLEALLGSMTATLAAPSRWLFEILPDVGLAIVVALAGAALCAFLYRRRGRGRT